MLDRAYDIFLETLANRNRLEIIDFLKNGSKTVTEISEELEMHQTTVSHNLARLEKCGFVTGEQQGKYCLYALNKETIEPLMKLIEKHLNKYCRKVCCLEEQEIKVLLQR